MANSYRANKKSGITPTGTKNITANGIYDVTNYESANVNVPIGVELPDTLEFGCDHTGTASGGSNNVNLNFGFFCIIPKFLCDNYTSFKITIPNVTTNFSATAQTTSGGYSRLTVNTIYSIASYVVSSGELKIRISNGGGSSSGSVSLTLNNVKITLMKS